MQIEFSICHNEGCELKQRCIRNISHHLDHKDAISSNFMASPQHGACYYFLPLEAFAMQKEIDPTFKG
jgi:hypothetical protein